MTDFKQWFAGERARALAQVLLTRRNDLMVRETKEENGLDYIVDVVPENGAGKRPFGVLVWATMAPATLDDANNQLKPQVANVQSMGPFNYPVCVFYFTAKDDRGYFAWVYEPVVTPDRQPRLKTDADAHCRLWNDESLDGIVDTVKRWYDAFYATLSA